MISVGIHSYLACRRRIKKVSSLFCGSVSLPSDKYNTRHQENGASLSFFVNFVNFFNQFNLLNNLNNADPRSICDEILKRGAKFYGR